MASSPKPLSMRMPRDDFGAPVPVLSVKPGGAKKGTAGAASSLIGPLSDTIGVIEIWAAGDIRYQTGDASVVANATSHFLAAGERHQRRLGGVRSGETRDTHIAIIRAGGTDAAVEISELE